MPDEVELKFELAPEALQQLEASHWFGELAGSARREELLSVYFDTDRLDLHHEGLSLRVRHAGQRRLQTVKVDRPSALARDESEQEIDCDVPDLTRARDTALNQLATKKLARRLAPVFETRVERTTVPLELNGDRLELAIDRGRIQAGQSSQHISELELELKAGRPQALVRLAKRLAEEFPVRYGAKSKAERGYALFQDQPIGPARAQDIELDQEVSVADALKTIGLSCLRHISLNEEAVQGADPEGVHQMRVGLRRLRAAISLFKEILGDPESEAVKAQLRWLTEQLAPARDYDVFVTESVVPMRDADPYQEELSKLNAVLDGLRADKFDNAKRALASDRYRQIIVTTALWLTGGDWTCDPDEGRQGLRERRMNAAACEILTQRTKKTAKKLRKLDQLAPSERHRLRIAVKKLHYGAEFFASLFPHAEARREHYVKVLKKLQAALGRLNDIHVHEEIAAEVISAAAAHGHGNASEPVFALGLVLGGERRECEQLVTCASEVGAKLVRLPHFWS